MATAAAVQEPQRYRFAVWDYERMGTFGILGEDDRVELIDGEIIQRSPIGVKHARCINRLTRRLVRALGEQAIVSIQNPIVLSDHDEPQPDVAVLRPSAEEHMSNPRPSDVFLVIEVSDSTLAYDRGVKLPLYARAGILEAWIADVDHDIISQYSIPSNGEYQVVATYQRGDAISSHVLPELSLQVNDILP
jgi:Uma2 family endonuclease